MLSDNLGKSQFYKLEAFNGYWINGLMSRQHELEILPLELQWVGLALRHGSLD